MSEILDLVNEDDDVIGQAERQYILSKQMHNYRVIGIFLLDKNKQILIPKRSMLCSMYPGRYDFSVAGHVISGESYHAAAEREAEEELGLPQGSLVLHEFLYAKYPNEYHLSSFSKYYYAFCETTAFQQNPIEVSSYRFMSFEEVFSLIQNRPEEFKSDFLPVFQKLYEVLASNKTLLSRNIKEKL